MLVGAIAIRVRITGFAYQEHRPIGFLGLVAFIVVMSAGRWCRGIRHHLILLRTTRSPIDSVVTRRDDDDTRDHFRSATRSEATRDAYRETGSQPRVTACRWDDRCTDIIAAVARCTWRAFPPRFFFSFCAARWLFLRDQSRVT